MYVISYCSLHFVAVVNPYLFQIQTYVLDKRKKLYFMVHFVQYTWLLYVYFSWDFHLFLISQREREATKDKRTHNGTVVKS